MVVFADILMTELSQPLDKTEVDTGWPNFWCTSGCH
jgi:hypothetical protein